MELKTVVINGQTFINTALVMDLEQSPSEYVPPANGLMAGMLRVDGVQSQAKTNMGKPRVHIHADGRVEFNEDVDWSDPASVLECLGETIRKSELGKQLAEELARLAGRPGVADGAGHEELFRIADGKVFISAKDVEGVAVSVQIKKPDLRSA